MPEVILEPVVDNIEAVAEPYRDLYEPRDGGKFALAKPIRIDDAAELKGALAQEREARRQLAEKAKNLPPEIADKIKKADELERRELERQGEYQKLLKTNEEKFRTEIEQRDQRIGTLTSTLENTIRVNDATRALSSARGDVEGLLPHLLPTLKAVEDPDKPGSYTTWVIDPAKPNEPRLNGKGQPMTIDERVSELREHRTLSKLFDASPANGPGGGGSNGFRQGQPRIVTITEEESRDNATYQRLKAQQKKGEIEGVALPDGRRVF